MFLFYPSSNLLEFQLFFTFFSLFMHIYFTFLLFRSYSTLFPAFIPFGFFFICFLLFFYPSSSIPPLQLPFLVFFPLISTTLPASLTFIFLSVHSFYMLLPSFLSAFSLLLSFVHVMPFFNTTFLSAYFLCILSSIFYNSSRFRCFQLQFLAFFRILSTFLPYFCPSGFFFLAFCFGSFPTFLPASINLSLLPLLSFVRLCISPSFFSLSVFFKSQLYLFYNSLFSLIFQTFSSRFYSYASFQLLLYTAQILILLFF